MKRKVCDEPSTPVKRHQGDFTHTDISTTCTTSNDDEESTTEKSGLFSNMIAFILPAGIQKKIINIFNSQIKKNGGTVYQEFKPELLITHIIVNDKMEPDRLLRIMKLDSAPVASVIKSGWLSNCLRHQSFLPYQEHQIMFPTVEKIEEQQDVGTSKSSENDSSIDTDVIVKQQQVFRMSDFTHHDTARVQKPVDDSDSDYIASDDDETEKGNTSIESMCVPNAVPIEKWICAQSSKNPKQNMNKTITDKLGEMVKAYESTNDKWRAFGYQKAIQALRRYSKEITTWEEAMSLPGVGKRLADKIWEIVDSGQLRKLQELESNEEVRVMETFTDVWGAGPTTAQQWYQQGFRTIQDLKEKAHLTHQQQVGVRLYDDLLERMPRDEATEIETIVREAAESIQTGIIAQTCGSYRRGKATCGDVDILVTHPDGKSHKGVFSKLLAKLKETGFLTDDLVSAEEAGDQKKYLGVCKLSGPDRKHRRLDIIVVPYSEYGCALVYFTGSAHFNRSLRHLCKNQNLSLNEHALKKGVVRKGAEKIYEGTVIPTPTEESVFIALNIPYRPPEERDH